MVESRQDEAFAIVGIFAVLAFLFVAVRIYSRYLGRNFGVDDYLIIVALIFFFAQTLTIWKFILLSGTGYHTWDLPKKTVAAQVLAAKWSMAVQMLYHPLMFLIRASIIKFLFRMKDTRRRVRYSLHVVFWLNILYAISTSLGNILQCSPIKYAWERPAMDSIDVNGNLVKGGQCFDSRRFILASCALSIFMDLIIIPIPSIMVWNLHMERKTKVLVVIVMSLGWIATGVSVGRFIVYFYRFAPTNLDRTWDIGIAISIAEPAVHIMTACAPATKCLFRYLFPWFGRTRTPAYYDEQGSNMRKPHRSKHGSKASRGTLGGFKFGLPGLKRRSDVEEIDMTGPTPKFSIQKDDNVHTMKRVESVSSMGTRLESHAEEKSLEAEAPRTSYAHTTTTSLGDACEAIPEHCLDRVTYGR